MSLHSSNTFNAMFANLLGITTDPTTMRRIPLAELVGTCTNGVAGVGHDKCGCPGFSGMMPATDGTWLCDSCQGYATKEDAEVKMVQARQEFASILRDLRSATITRPNITARKRTRRKP